MNDNFPIRIGHILKGALFSEPMRVETVRPAGQQAWTAGLGDTAPPAQSVLADAFKRAGMVERIARGIDTIFYEQRRNGRPAPSYERSTPTSVSVVLPGGTANLDFVRLTKAAYVRQRGFEPVQQGQAILQYVAKHGRITRGETAELCPPGPYQASRFLRKLATEGKLMMHGKGKRSW